MKKLLLVMVIALIAGFGITAQAKETDKIGIALVEDKLEDRFEKESIVYNNLEVGNLGNNWYSYEYTRNDDNVVVSGVYDNSESDIIYESYGYERENGSICIVAYRYRYETHVRGFNW